MKLYFTKGACSLAVRILINELELNSEFESVDLQNKKTEKGENYLHINSKGSVPALLLDEGGILTENAVILQYLADNNNATHLLPQVGDLNRYRVLEWVNFITTELHKGAAAFFNPKISPELKNEIFKPILESKLKWVENNLKEKEFLMGNEFTLPDIYLFVILSWMPIIPIDLKIKYPVLSTYFENLKKRPSIQKSQQAENFKS